MKVMRKQQFDGVTRVTVSHIGNLASCVEFLRMMQSSMFNDPVCECVNIGICEVVATGLDFSIHWYLQE